MLKYVYTTAVLICLLLEGALAARPTGGPSYAAREAELAATQYGSPGKALSLAKALMKDHPRQCRPYEIAANIHCLQKNFSAAEITLQAAVDRCAAPPALFVRLGRLYQRAAPQKLNPWVDSMLKRRAVKNRPTLAAKLLGIGKERREAIQYLEAVARTDSYCFDVCLMLSRLYSGENQPAKALALLKAFGESHGLNRRTKARLLKEIFSLPLAFDHPQIDFCLRLIIELAAVETGYETGRRQLSENLKTLMRFDGEHHIEGLIRANLSRRGDQDLWVWLGAIFLQNIEKPQAAHAMLTEVNTTDARLLEEKARLSVHSGDPELISKSWQALLHLFPDDVRIGLAYAQSLNRAGFRAESRQAAARLHHGLIPEDLRQAYFDLCFDNAAALKKYEDLTATWFEAGKYYTYNDFLFFKKRIFHHFKTAEDYRRLLKLLQAKQFETPAAGAAGGLLKAFIAEALGDEKRYFAAADEYLSRRSADDARIINLFVDSAINSTALHHKEEKTATRPPQAAQFALKWSTILAERHPDNFIYNSNRIISAYLAGQISDPAEAYRKLLTGKEKNHHQLKRLGARLFSIGCFPLAARCYEAAIALRPDILRYRYNYAACLIKLHQYRQAEQIYIGLITRPPERSWDMAAVLRQLWFCYENLDSVTDFPVVIENLTRNPVVDANGLRLAAGAVLLEKAQFRPAEQMLQQVIRDSLSEEERYSAYHKLAKCCVLQKKYDTAVRIFSICLQRYSRDALKRIDCLYNRAEIQRRKGAYQAAIEDWRLIAQGYPSDDLAPLALLRAAAVAHEKMHDLPQAGRLYEACLALPQKDKKLAAAAREKLALIRERDR